MGEDIRFSEVEIKKACRLSERLFRLAAQWAYEDSLPITETCWYVGLCDGLGPASSEFEAWASNPFLDRAGDITWLYAYRLFSRDRLRRGVLGISRDGKARSTCEGSGVSTISEQDTRNLNAVRKRLRDKNK